MAGGMCSVMFLAGAVFVIGTFGYQFFAMNKTITEQLIAGQSPLDNAHTGVSFSVRVGFIGDEGACSDLQVTSTGFLYDSSQQPTWSPETYNTATTQSCSMIWTCSNCSLLSDMGVVHVEWTDRSIKANMIYWHANCTDIPPAESNSNSNSNSVQGTAIPSDSSKAFRGSTATTAMINIVPTTFRYYDSPPISGYRLVHGRIVAGSEVDQSSFYDQTDSVIVEVRFMPFNSGYALVSVGMSETVVDLLVRWISLLVGLMTACGVILCCWESMPKRLRHGKKQRQAEHNKSERKKQYDIELNPLTRIPSTTSAITTSPVNEKQHLIDEPSAPPTPTSPQEMTQAQRMSALALLLSRGNEQQQQQPQQRHGQSRSHTRTAVKAPTRPDQKWWNEVDLPEPPRLLQRNPPKHPPPPRTATVDTQVSTLSGHNS